MPRYASALAAAAELQREPQHCRLLPVAAYSRDAEAPAAVKCAADQKAQTLADLLYWASCPDAGETRRRLEIGDVLKMLAPG